MSFDRTQTQHGDEHRRAQQLSLERTRPPSDVPGYDAQRFLGAGAYGEVWVAVDRNTGRQVAIKFYTHRGGLDWPLLSREVEKLVFLSADRYVVQLLDVGWDAEPPYYVMEYIDRGSLEDRLRAEGTLPVAQAVAMFREVAIGLVHAHGRGVLHCDLKPANVLLDQDDKPRLADFGQSRLSHEQDPALGTLFYMAPEQADLKAVPDARWDVYALGAILHAMLTGAPPHRTDEAVQEMEGGGDLEERLDRYRRLIHESPTPAGHRQVRGVDRGLAEIVDRCLSKDPKRRFPNPQAVIAALDAREARRGRRPLLVLGMIGPALLMLVMGLAAWRGLDTVVQKSDQALTQRALASNHFAARAQAEAVASELERRYRAVERLAADPEFQLLVETTFNNPELTELIEKLNDPAVDDPDLVEEFRRHPARQPLQQWFEKLMEDESQPVVASWFFNGPSGLQGVRGPYNQTIGRNYAWRTYFHGGVEDKPEDWRPPAGEHVEKTRLSAVFRSEASRRWIAGISTPVYQGGPGGKFLGVVAMTVEVGRFVELQGTTGQLAVLVDWRDGPNKGLILQHPLFDALIEEQGKLPDRFKDYRIAPENLPRGDHRKKARYRDPLGEDEHGGAYRDRWLAEMAVVPIKGEDSGLMVIVQETYNHAIGPTLASLKQSLLTIGMIASGVVVAVLTVLWGFVARVLGGSTRGHAAPDTPSTLTPAETMATIAVRKRR